MRTNVSVVRFEPLVEPTDEDGAMRLFLSYRRGDSAGHTGRLFDALVARLGDDSVFQDVEMTPGVDFLEAIERELSRSDVLLAVIGPTWASATGPGHAIRLADPDDVVRLELLTALGLGITVVPVLVDGAALPDEAVVPEELRPLLRRQAVSIRDTSWQRDVEALIGSLRGEQVPSLGARRKRSIIVGVAAVAVAALVVAIVASRRDTAGSSSSTEPPSCISIDDGSLAARPILVDPEATVTPSGSPPIRIGVLAAYTRPLAPGRWLLLVKSRLTNVGQGDDISVGDYRYQFVTVDGTTYPVTCFGVVAGNSVVAPSLNSIVVVGAEVTTDPKGELAFVLDTGTLLRFASRQTA